MERLPQQCLKSVTLEAFTFEKINKSSDLYVVQIAAAKENEINMVHHPVFRTKFSLPLFSLDGNVLHSGHSEYDGIKLNETTKKLPVVLSIRGLGAYLVLFVSYRKKKQQLKVVSVFTASVFLGQ